MNNLIKKSLYLLILVILLLLGLGVSFILEEGFLQEIGLSTDLAVASVILVLGIKIVSEITYFKSNVRTGVKIFSGVVAAFLILVTLSSIFFVRMHKENKVFFENKKEQKLYTQKKDLVSDSIKELKENKENQLKSIDEQIKSLDSTIKIQNDFARDTEIEWRKLYYVRKSRNLQTEKQKLLKEKLQIGNDFDKKIEKEKSNFKSLIVNKDKEHEKIKDITIGQTIFKVLNVEEKDFIIFVNGIITLAIEISIFYISMLISFTLFNTQVKETKKENSKVVKVGHPVKLEKKIEQTDLPKRKRGRPPKQQFLKPEDIIKPKQPIDPTIMPEPIYYTKEEIKKNHNPKGNEKVINLPKEVEQNKKKLKIKSLIKKK